MIRNPHVPIPRIQEFSSHSQSCFTSVSIHCSGSTFWSRFSPNTSNLKRTHRQDPVLEDRGSHWAGGPIRV